MEIGRIGQWYWRFINPPFLLNKNGWYEKYWVRQLEVQLCRSISQSWWAPSEFVFNQSYYTFLILKYIVEIRVLRILMQTVWKYISQYPMYLNIAESNLQKPHFCLFCRHISAKTHMFGLSC
jgi:hypothetical protein